MLMRFLWNLYGISMVLLWDVFAIAIGFLLDSCGISMICLWCFYWISMEFPWVSLVFWWDCYGIPLDFHDVFSDISLGCFWDFHRVIQGFRNSSGFSWGFYGTSMAFLWYSSGIFCFLLDFHEFLLDFFVISRGFLLDSCGISLLCLWYFKKKNQKISNLNLNLI